MIPPPTPPMTQPTAAAPASTRSRSLIDMSRSFDQVDRAGVRRGRRPDARRGGRSAAPSSRLDPHARRRVVRTSVDPRATRPSPSAERSTVCCGPVNGSGPLVATVSGGAAVGRMTVTTWGTSGVVGRPTVTTGGGAVVGRPGACTTGAGVIGVTVGGGTVPGGFDGGVGGWFDGGFEGGCGGGFEGGCGGGFVVSGHGFTGGCGQICDPHPPGLSGGVFAGCTRC